MHPRHARTRGFTLIELMITVAIIAVLAAIALPSYQDYVRKGRRADGRALLQAASLAQEKFRLGNASYSSATTNLSPPCGAGTCTSEQGYYTLAIGLGASPTGYILTANAVSTSSQANDTGCTAIVLTMNAGSISYTPATCWGK